MSRDADGWRSHDLAVDEYSALDDLGSALRALVSEENLALALIEHEDEWFALVRADDDSDPQIFASDVDSVAKGPFAELLSDVIESVKHIDLTTTSEDTSTNTGGDLAMTDVLTSAPAVTATHCGGDPSILADVGLPASDLLAIVDRHDGDPGAVLSEIGDALGFSDLVEGLR